MDVRDISLLALLREASVLGGVVGQDSGRSDVVVAVMVISSFAASPWGSNSHSSASLTGFAKAIAVL